MPELPEVECLRLQWKSWIQRPLVLELADGSLLSSREEARLRHLLLNNLSSTIERRGKLLLTRFPSGEGWIQHLGMTGKWVNRQAPYAGKSRALLQGQDTVLVFQDMRRFGKWWFGPVHEAQKLSGWNRLGPDALDETDLALKALIASRKRRVPIRNLLLEQSLVSGVGNIVATEALFEAGIHPAQRTNTLSEESFPNLIRCIQRVIHRSIERDRGREIAYQGERGAKNPFRVYGHETRSCDRCSTPISRIVLGGRSAFFCPMCQPEGGPGLSSE